MNEQRLVQEQQQKLVQQQRLTQQQMMVVKMLEMPGAEMAERVQTELLDNPALERADDGDEPVHADMENTEPTDADNFDEQTEREEREDALENALAQMGDNDDDIAPADPFDHRPQATAPTLYEADTPSFFDHLMEQMGEVTLTEQERNIMEYIIGSIEDDGWLHKDIDTICDELAIYNNIDVAESEIERVLAIVQTFDPPGVGARSLQECLLLQIDRRDPSPITQLMRSVVKDHFTAFTHKHWDKIGQELQLTDTQVQTLRTELGKLNPKPGSAYGSASTSRLQQITPDFIVDTAADGTLTFSLNDGDIPPLRVSNSFLDMVDTYKRNKDGMNRNQKEALLYARDKVDRAQGFIRAVQQRQHTLTVTMQAIIDWQRAYFQDGDESELRPMILKNIASVTGLDISTISRVANEKYVQTQWGIHPLKFFFSDGYVASNGEETSTRRLLVALQEIVKNEDKQNPLSDDDLAAKMKEMGFPVARRTVAKYRGKLGIPVARLRK